MIGLALLLQIAIVPMTMDSIAATPDSVTFRVAWGFDTTNTPIHPAAPDSLRLYYQRSPMAARTVKLTPAARSVSVKFSQRKGYETAQRVVCLRYWKRLVPTIRCITKATPYLYRLFLVPDSVILEAAPPTPVVPGGLW